MIGLFWFVVVVLFFLYMDILLICFFYLFLELIEWYYTLCLLFSKYRFRFCSLSMM